MEPHAIIDAREFGPFLLNDFAWELRPRQDNPSPPCFGPEWFEKCLRTKLDECGDRFAHSVRTHGIQQPATILYCRRGMAEDEEGPGRPLLMEGHHRFAWAWFNEVPLPVMFFNDGAGDVKYSGRGNLPDSYQ